MRIVGIAAIVLAALAAGCAEESAQESQASGGEGACPDQASPAYDAGADCVSESTGDQAQVESGQGGGASVNP